MYIIIYSLVYIFCVFQNYLQFFEYSQRDKTYNMEEEETIDDISETQYLLYENVATESQFDEISMDWNENEETDNKRKSNKRK